MSEQPDNIKQKIILALIEKNGIVSEACRSIGLSRSTYYDWVNNDPEFKKAVDDVQDVAIDYVEGKLFESIGKGSDTAIIFYLKTKAKKRGYVERQEMTGANGGPIQTEEVTGMIVK